MIFLDTRWRPGRGALGGFTGDLPDGHIFAPEAAIPFPPVGDRTLYQLQSGEVDAWAAALGLSDLEAFVSFGPVGRGEGRAEPASEWQAILNLLRATAEVAYTKAGKRKARAELGDLVAAVDSHIRDGKLYPVAGPAGIRMHARTVAAFLASSALADIAAGVKLGICEECGRRMVVRKSGQRFCSAKCRMRFQRKKGAS